LLEQLDPVVLQMSTGFGGGVGDTQQELCGLLSVGVMLIGALHGRDGAEQDNTRVNALVQRYRQRFQAEFGTTTCEPLAQRVEANQNGFNDCAQVGERAAEILLDVLEQVPVP
jgi:C_GCAxxG_C_C family probable redox protein